MKWFGIIAILLAGAELTFGKQAATIFPPVTVTPTLPICHVRCNLFIGEPICTIRNGQYRIFENACSRMSHYCQTAQDYNLVDMELCAENICPIPCSVGDNVYVCAHNAATNQYQSFDRMCDFLNFACTSSLEWTRISSDTFTCP